MLSTHHIESETCGKMQISRRLGTICFYFIVFLLSVSVVQAQELRDYYVSCNPTEFEYLIEHPEENTPIVCTVEYDSQVWLNVSLSLYPPPYSEVPKKSFKITFDETELFHDRQIVNLKAEWHDPTFCREYLAYDLCHRAGLEAPLSWFVRLYINGIYMGLYLDVEEVDQYFLERSALDDDATIYKADQVGCLLRPGEALNSLWEKVTNQSTGVYDLWDLIEWIDIAHEEYFLDDFIDYFGEAALPRLLAVNALLGNNSTYYHNYLLVNDLDPDGIWTMIPWDADSCLVYEDEYTEPEYYKSGHPMLAQTNALVSKCWEHDAVRNLILEHIEGITDSLFTQSYYQGLTTTLNNLLTTAVEEDTAKQFTYDEFYNGLRDIGTDANWRGYKVEWNKTHRPMPFDLNPALLTPTGIYLSWDTTSISTGASISYKVQIATDRTFENIVADIYTSFSNSLLYDFLDAGYYFWRAFAVNPTNLTTRTLTYWSTFEIPEDAFTGTTVTGPIETSTTWGIEGSPYSLPQGITVAPGAVLTIEPGVLVGVGPGQSITIEGGLNAVGTLQDSIYFVPINPDYYWGSLNFTSPTDDIDIGYANLTKMSSDYGGPFPGGAIQHYEAQVYMFDCHIYDGVNWGMSGEQSDLHLERVILEQFTSGLGNNLAEASTILRDCRFQFEAAYGPSWGLVDIELTNEYSEISRCLFYGNKLNDTGDNIDLDNCYNFSIDRNYFRGAGDKAITLGNCHDISITNNIITDCYAAFGLKNGTDAVIYNNVIFGNLMGVKVVNDITSFNVYNSVIWGNDEDITPYGSSDVHVNYSLIGGATAYPGQGNIAGDPRFVDAYHGNFYPLDDSPLIDAGYGTGQPELDLIDSTRIDIPSITNSGSGEIDYVDIGVYEYREGVQYPPAVEPEEMLPSRFELLGNYPNPFNGTTHIEFSIVKTGGADITVYDVAGREVYSRHFDRLLPGIHTIMWNGRNQHNQPVASGTYICQLTLQHQASRAIKMVLLK